jgi:hypothetical protein
MNAFHDLDLRLDNLGRELAGRASFADDVMAQIAAGRLRLPPRRWLRAAGPALLAASLLIAAVVWFSTSRSLYAQAIAALEKAKTIHVTGWTSRPLRKWPLESPPKSKEDGKVQFDAWYWTGQDRRPRCYEKAGPVTLVRDGAELREYQSDVDLLFISKGSPNDYVERFSSLAFVLEALRNEGAASEDLGMKTENGKKVRGLKLIRHGDAEEYWFDAQTNLPTLYTSRAHADKNERAINFELHFAYDEQIPAAIASYRPPQAKHVRYGGQHDDVQIVWRQHVQELGRRMQQEHSGEAIAVVPRSDRQTFSLQYAMLTPDEKHWVVPLDLNQYSPLSVRDFVRLRAAIADGDHAVETWRVPKELLAVEFPRTDLVFEKDTPWRQWVGFALNSIGLEFADVLEERTYWIAEHDGRKLKPYQQVQPPVPYLVQGGKEQKGLVKPGVGYHLRPITMHELFADFNRLQNEDLGGRNPIIVDHTGLPREPQWERSKYPTRDEYQKAVNFDRYLVATDSPWFAGEESQAMARVWYKNEFGVTFKEEQRELTIHIIRRRP